MNYMFQTEAEHQIATYTGEMMITLQYDSPVRVMFCSRYDEEGCDSEVTAYEAADYVDEINDFLAEYESRYSEEEGGMGLAYYLHDTFEEEARLLERVRGISISFHVRDGNLRTLATVAATEELDDEDTAALIGYLLGQYSDGWGEGFEQQPISVRGGDLYVSTWFPKGFEFMELQ